MYIDAQELPNIVEEIVAFEGTGGIIGLFIGEENTVDLEELALVLSTLDLAFFGVILPGVFGESEFKNDGIVIKHFPAPFHFHVIKDINSKAALTKGVQPLSKGLKDGKSAMIFIDGLSASVHSCLFAIFDQLGDERSYLGGGAGSLSLEQKPCLFDKNGIYQDAAFVVELASTISLGVNHGWTPIAGPFVVTESDKNTIKQLNWESAIDTYREFVEKDSGQELDLNNFFETAMGYPFGIISDGDKLIVRDPISVNDDGDLFCVGEVPEHSVLNILKGIPEQLIEAARDAALASVPNSGLDIEDVLVIDCISRVLFLQDNFPEEIRTIQEIFRKVDRAIPVEGILTLGEIASSGLGLLEFYNKTIVCAAFSSKAS